MDIAQAMLDPVSVFTSPQDVCHESSLTQDQKIKILRRWEYDARELAVAEEENMLGGSANVLDEVLAALHQLNAKIDLEHSPPTKQGGE